MTFEEKKSKYDIDIQKLIELGKEKMKENDREDSIKKIKDTVHKSEVKDDHDIIPEYVRVSGLYLLIETSSPCSCLLDQFHKSI